MSASMQKRNSGSTCATRTWKADPESGPDRNAGDIVVGQLTVPASVASSFSAQMTLQGRSIFDRRVDPATRLVTGDWEQTVSFTL